MCPPEMSGHPLRVIPCRQMTRSVGAPAPFLAEYPIPWARSASRASGVGSRNTEDSRWGGWPGGRLGERLAGGCLAHLHMPLDRPREIAYLYLGHLAPQ
ncbi:MAG: hypothetical protein J2P37_27785, partial [Ktedonobacteraceae bacterium]|nr:hypothetical protein [Ktedonobacteraceae bacterium]